MPFPNSSFARAGKYTQIHPIGQGSGGNVYRAVDNLRRVVAVKEALPSHTGFIDTLQRFEKEARIQAILKHPKIIQVYHLEEDPQTHELYLICEYANGGSLTDHLKAHGPLPEEQAIRITLDICAALEEVSGKRFVHLDIKPSNVLLFNDDQGHISEAKLGDFGIAKDLDKRRAGQPSTQRGGSHPGTPEYMAPEQADITQPVDVRTDLYALGISLWEMLTGKDYKLVRVSTGTPVLHTHNPQASLGIAEVIQRAVKADRIDRYPTPRAMCVDLQDVLNGRSLSPRPTIPFPPQTPPPRARVGLMRATSILVMCLALALIGYRVWRGSVQLPSSVGTAASLEATSVARETVAVTPPAPTDKPTNTPMPTPTDTPTPTLLMTTVLTFTSRPNPAAGRQIISLPLNQPGRYMLVLTQAKNPTGQYWLIWDYIGLRQDDTPIWEIGEAEAPPDYTEAAFSEFCKPHIRPDCTSNFVVGTTSVRDFVYDINNGERPGATITFTITDQQANPALKLELSTLYASHDQVERFALKVSLVRMP